MAPCCAVLLALCVVGAESRQKCGPSGIKGDFGYKACSAFCKEASSASHCKFCKRSLNTQRSVLRYRA